MRLTSLLLDDFRACLCRGRALAAEVVRSALALFRLASLLAPDRRGVIIEARAARGGRSVCALSDGRVSLETTYAEWVVPLARLPRGATPEEFRRAAESLPGYDPADVLHLFPLDSYLRATRRAARAGAVMVHVVRASTETTHSLLHALAGVDAAEVPNAPPPALLLLSDAPAPALCNRTPLH
jgi:hypothetical protein